MSTSISSPRAFHQSVGIDSCITSELAWLVEMYLSSCCEKIFERIVYREAADVFGSPRAIVSICLVTARTFLAAVSMRSGGKHPRVVA